MGTVGDREPLGDYLVRLMIPGVLGVSSAHHTEDRKQRGCWVGIAE